MRFFRRVHRRYRRIARIDRQEITDVGNLRVQTAEPAHAMLDLGNYLRLAVVLVDAEVLTQLIEGWQHRDGRAERNAASLLVQP